jgi:hypothetical protein
LILTPGLPNLGPQLPHRVWHSAFGAGAYHNRPPEARILNQDTSEDEPVQADLVDRVIRYPLVLSTERVSQRRVAGLVEDGVPHIQEHNGLPHWRSQIVDSLLV